MVIIVVAVTVLIALGMVLRVDWHSVEVDARLTKWVGFTLKLRKRSPPSTAPGRIPESGPADPEPVHGPSSLQARRGRERPHPIYRSVDDKHELGYGVPGRVRVLPRPELLATLAALGVALA
ncbi:MAG TPA: hypothetical protein VLJ59_16485 [Mycobacteriales bacterium]|nr:hypothetical protein [Mycobacteriales bacterium]